MQSKIDRKRIFIFVAITYGLTAAAWLLNTAGGGPSGELLSMANVRLLLMFFPMLAHIATRLMTREGWANTYLRPDLKEGRWRYYLAAWILPYIAAAVGGTIFYLLFPQHFDPSMTLTRAEITDPSLLSMKPAAFFFTQLGLGLISPWSFSLLLNLGEEFGWRAYLLPKLKNLGWGKAILLVGVLHGVWHWPSIFQGSDYGLNYWGAPFAGPLLFAVMCCTANVFYAWVTLRSGSVWPAVLFHGAFNTANRLVWYFFAGEVNAVIGPGAQGIVGMLGYAALAVLVWRHLRGVGHSAQVGIASVEYLAEPRQTVGPA